MDIKTKTEQPLLSRTEVKTEITFNKATPAKDEIKKQISTELKADEKLIVIKSINTIYGTKTADILAYVYKDEASLKKIEPKPKEKKAKPAEKPKEAGEAKEAPKEEAKPAPEKEKPAEKEKPTEKKEAKQEKPDEKKETK